MIVIYEWRTRKIEHYIRKTETFWKGVFLFGVIPLFIWANTKKWTD
jgi:hypothetical protein